MSDKNKTVKLPECKSTTVLRNAKVEWVSSLSEMKPKPSKPRKSIRTKYNRKNPERGENKRNGYNYSGLSNQTTRLQMIPV